MNKKTRIVVAKQQEIYVLSLDNFCVIFGGLRALESFNILYTLPHTNTRMCID